MKYKIGDKVLLRDKNKDYDGYWHYNNTWGTIIDFDLDNCG